MYLAIKRAIDVVLSAMALLILAPLLVPIGIALRFSGEGEVFYGQKRVGYKTLPFNILKFATMLKDSPNMAGGEITLRDDPRLTPLGPFLRRTKINELPQILNVLKGEMTIVGPRPLMQVSFDLYTPQVQKIVYESKPGMTGIASLVFRDEESLVWDSGVDPKVFYRETIYPYKGQLESWYYENRSLVTDLKIFVLTLWSVVFPRSNAVHTWFQGLPARPTEL